MTHNTKEYRKYDEKGKLLDSFGWSQRNRGNHTNKKPREKFDSRSFVQMLSKDIARDRRHSGSSAVSDDSSWHDGLTSQVANLDDTLVNKTTRLRLDTFSSIYNSLI